MEDTIQAVQVEERAAPASVVGSRRLEYGLWLAMCVISSVLIAFVQWPIKLGSVALPWLRTSHEYPWRVWWRPRNDYVNASHHILLYIIMGAALAVCFVGTALICLLLLLHANDEERASDEP